MFLFFFPLASFKRAIPLKWHCYSKDLSKHNEPLAMIILRQRLPIIQVGMPKSQLQA